MKNFFYRFIMVSFIFTLAACTAPASLNENGTTVFSKANTASQMLESTPAPTPTRSSETGITPTPDSAKTKSVSSDPIEGVKTRDTAKDKMVEIYIPAGEFTMGAVDDTEAKLTWTGGRSAPETPSFKYSLEGYWIDKFEVTNEQWAMCMADGVCKSPTAGSYTPDKYFTDQKYAKYPVTSIDWYMAGVYCKWAGRRLPTEAEWEKAARSTDARMYPWGNEPVTGKRANFCDKDCPRLIANPNYDDGYPEMAPVGSYPDGASPYGVMDMSGNVWEWTSTIIQAYPYDAKDGREDQELRAERVWRGGPWSNGTWWMRSSLRYRSVQTYYISNLGVRCASSE